MSPPEQLTDLEVRGVLERRAQLAETLRRFGELAVASEGEELPGLVVEAAQALARGDRGVLARTSAERAEVVCATGVCADLLGTTLAIDAEALTTSLGRQVPLVVEDTQDLDPNSFAGAMARRYGTASFVLVTLRFRGAPVGVLFVGSGTPRRYHSEEVEALGILSSMAASCHERTRAHEELRGRREWLDALVEHLPIPVAVYRRDGTTAHDNAAMRDLGSLLHGDGTRSWRDSLAHVRVLDSSGRPFALEELPVSRVFAGERPPPVELILSDSENKRRAVMMAMAAPLPSAQGGVQEAIVALQDVTAERRLAEAKDRFLGMASHELRSPLASLRASASLLELDPSAADDPERRRVLVGRIQRQIDRLARLIDQLLDTSRLGAGQLPLQLSEGDLGQVCGAAIELAGEGTPRIALRVEGPASGKWDLDRLEQVLVNLIANALRYSGAEAPVEVRVWTTETQCCASVSDQGIGVPPDQVKDLFRPFFRADNAIAAHRDGLGLGLHIASEIVRRHGGTLQVEARRGGGSTFTMTLPR